MAKINQKKLAEEVVALGELAAISTEKLSEKTAISMKRLDGKKKFKKKHYKKISKVLQIPKPIVKLMGVEANNLPKEAGELLSATQEYVKSLIESRTEKKLKKKKTD